MHSGWPVYAFKKQHHEQASTRNAGVLTIDSNPRVAGLHVGHGGLQHRKGVSSCCPMLSHSAGTPTSLGARKASTCLTAPLVEVRKRQRTYV